MSGGAPHWAALTLAAALALPAMSFAQVPPVAAPLAAPVIPPVTPPVTPQHFPVGGKVDTLAGVQRGLNQGYRAVLLLGLEPLDGRVCRIFLQAYHDSLIEGESDKLIYFPRKASYSDTAHLCDELNAAYDTQLLFQLNEGDLLSAMRPGPTLMIVCRDARGELVNKGYVAFSRSDADNVLQRRFIAFDSYYRKGPTAWRDGRQIDGSMDLLDALGHLVLFRSPKNTPCH
jgi:hypothetical protein